MEKILTNSSFGTIDYVVFIVLLLISFAIGLFGFINNGNKTTEEYLLGGRKLKIIPVGLSLMASQLSGISIIAIPADMYVFGTQFYMIAPVMIFPVLILNYVFISVFYKTQVSDCYKYLEMRFDKDVKNFVTMLFLIGNLLILPTTMYIPSLALSQVTGINLHLINIVVSSIFIIITMTGIEAIIWADVFQGIIMLGSCIIIMIIAINSAGGTAAVWAIAEAGERLELFNMKLDLTTRHTFWNVLFGYTTLWCSFLGLNQSCVQRILAMPSIQHARKAIWIFFIGFFIITTIVCLSGISMYAKYFDCDPLKLGIVDQSDKMIPYFVQDVAQHLPGISGIFISSVFCAGLSTMAATLNGISSVIYYDYIAVFKLFTPTDKNVNRFLKFQVIIIGIFSIAAGFVVAQFKYLLQLVVLVSGISQGAIFGIFSLGMLWPYCNKKGALAGGLVSFCIMLWVSIGAQILTLRGDFDYPTLPTSIEGCEALGVNETNSLFSSSNTTSFGDSFSIYKIAFPWYTAIGSAITIVVGVLVSLCTGGSDLSKLHSRLFCSIVHGALPKQNEVEISTIENKTN